LHVHSSADSADFEYLNFTR